MATWPLGATATLAPSPASAVPSCGPITVSECHDPPRLVAYIRVLCTVENAPAM